MRFDNPFVNQVAKDFVTSSVARVWPFVGDDLRDALIDQRVMECVRMAATVDNPRPFTPSDLLDLRAAIVKRLWHGVPMGSGRKRLWFDRDMERPTETKESA